MKINQYISVFLLALFITKFLVFDAKIISLITENDQVVYINPFCKKTNFIDFDSAEQILDFTNTEATYIAAQCTSIFQFKIYHWEPRAYDPLSTINSFKVPIIDGLYHDKNYPPPRAA